MGCGCKKNKGATSPNTSTQPQQTTTSKINLTKDMQKQVDAIVETIKKLN